MNTHTLRRRLSCLTGKVTQRTEPAVIQIVYMRDWKSSHTDPANVAEVHVLVTPPRVPRPDFDMAAFCAQTEKKLRQQYGAAVPVTVTAQT